MTRFSWVLSIFLPGLGQLVSGRLWRSLFFLVVALIGIDLIILGKFFSGDSSGIMFSSGLITFGVVWLLALFELFYFQHTFDPRKLEPVLVDHLKKGAAYYLASDYESARSELKAGLKKAPNDIELNLYLAGVLREMGEKKKAIRQLKKVLVLDDAGKWSWQIEREMKLL